MIHPIFTEKTECQDCYKCVRHCPVKAIKVEKGHADIQQDRCILCGKCVRICPASAQKVRNDIPRAKQLLKIKNATYVSLAPSFPSEFGNNKNVLIGKLKALGFAGVSETALGAELIIDKQSKENLQINKSVVSSACPVVVELFKKYYPNKSSHLSEYVSPMIAHGQILRETYGDDIGIVFIGPCLAKKIEADENSETINVALTFNELKEWFNEVEPMVKPMNLDEIGHRFIPFSADVGTLYPLDGGEEEIRRDNGFHSITGINQVIAAFEEIDDTDSFIEMLACSGGCINGSAMKHDGALISRRQEILNYYRDNKLNNEARYRLNVGKRELKRQYFNKLVARHKHNEVQINQTLKLLNKVNEDDMLNCGGCGYNSCKEFAEAMLDDLAELQMCVTHMRLKAQKKANALIQTIPLGVTIINEEDKIIETNERFIELFMDKRELNIEKALSSIIGSKLSSFIELNNLTSTVLIDGFAKEDIITHEKRVIKVHLFPIEKGILTGVIFQDITEPAMKRDTVIKKADEVIQKNLRSVQQIASLLGENAAETEILLNSLIEAFKNPQDGNYEPCN